MNSKIIDASIGAIGIVATEVVEKAPPISPEEIGTIGNLLIQIAIGIVTLFGIFKRKKPKI